MPGFDAGLEIGFAGEEELKTVYNVARQRLSCTAFAPCCSLDEQEGKAVAPARVTVDPESRPGKPVLKAGSWGPTLGWPHFVCNAVYPIGSTGPGFSGSGSCHF